jgi:hypothetical protein
MRERNIRELNAERTYVSGSFLKLLELLHDPAVIVHCNQSIDACSLSLGLLELIIPRAYA